MKLIEIPNLKSNIIVCEACGAKYKFKIKDLSKMHFSSSNSCYWAKCRVCGKYQVILRINTDGTE